MWELLGRLEYSWERKSIIKKYFRKNIFYTSHHLPPAGVEQHAVSVVLVDRLDLLVAALVEGLGRGADVLLSIRYLQNGTGHYLLYLGRPGLDQEVEGGGDEGEADVLHHLGLVRRHRDRPLLQVHLRTTTLDTMEIHRD